jgi:hypothetical protein
MAFTLVSGRAYMIVLTKQGSGTKSWSAVDYLAGSTNVCGNYVETSDTNTDRAAVITCICTTGGAANITVSVNSGTATWRWQIIEITPASGTLSWGGSSTAQDSATGTSHPMAAASGFNPPADSAIVGVGGPSAATGTTTAATNYQKQSGTTGNFFSQTRMTSSALTNETATFTTTNSVKEHSAIVYVTESSGSSSISVGISGTASFADSYAATLGMSASMAAAGAFADSPSGTFPTAISLAASAAFQESAAAIVSQLISLAGQAVLADSIGWLPPGTNISISQAAVAGILTSTQATYVAAVNQAAQAALAAVSVAVASQAASMGATALIAEALAATNREALALAVQAALAGILSNAGSSPNPNVIRVIMEAFSVSLLINEDFSSPMLVNEEFAS